MNPWTPFEWIAAIRFLREGRSQTVLTIFGAAMGVAVIVFMSALIVGIQANIFNKVLSTQPHISITAPDEVSRPLRGKDPARELATIQPPAQRLTSIDQWQQIQARLEQRADVVVVAESTSGSAFAVRGDASRGLTLTGVDPANFYGIVDLPGKIVAGNAWLLPGEVVIGRDLAIKLGTGLGEKLRMRTTTLGGAPAEQTFTIAGLFDLGDRSANERSAFVPIRAAQSLFGLPGGVTKLSINLTDAYQAEVVAEDLRLELGVNAESWIVAFGDLFNALRTQSISFGVIEFFVAVAVALGIASVLVVSVVQRAPEIGILRAMGATRGQVLRVFLIQGALVGLTGSVFGALMARGFVALWRAYALNIDGSTFFVITLPASLLAMTGLIATLTGLVAAILPALSAARLDPAQAMRG